jgi:biotin carboxyl carrier protein
MIMTGYTITVNGKSYDVLVQKKATSPILASGNNCMETAVLLNSVSVTASSAAKSGALLSDEGEKVVAPMPGKIIEINVRVGERVKQGQTLLIMEAMKMHNPILAAKDGVVVQLFVKVNDPVQSGQSLLAIR